MVEPANLQTYVLNPSNPVGGHKARVFAAALGITVATWEVLQDALVAVARDGEAQYTGTDQWGERYVIDFDMRGSRGQVRVRSNWIIDAGSDLPRLTSCHVRKR